MRRVVPPCCALALVLATACRPTPAPQSPAPAPVAAAPSPSPAPHSPATPAPEPAVAVAPPWKDADLPRILAVQPLVHAAADRHGVDANVLNAIIWHESRFHAKAKGPGGAAGLMQLMPTTSKGLAKRLGRANKPYDAAFNVEAGALLMSRLLEIFDGDLELAIAGYGLGHVAVQRRQAAGEPLPERTQRFIAHVLEWAPAFATLPPPERGAAKRAAR